MARLSERKSKLVFTTADEIRERGKYRAVVIEARPNFAMVRLAGTRTAFPISYSAIYCAAARQAAERLRAEKKAAKRTR